MCTSALSQTTGFLSTPSARRATQDGTSSSSGRLYFYPRPPRGGRLDAATLTLRAQIISIHALREEGDGTQSLTPF